MLLFVIFFFFKQKTAYEMRISDWSSDVCSSDLLTHASPRRIGTLVAHEGIMLEVSGFPQPLCSNVRIKSANNDYVYGEVVGFRGHRSLVLPFDTNMPLVTGPPVEPHGASSMVAGNKTQTGRAHV